MALVVRKSAMHNEPISEEAEELTSFRRFVTWTNRVILGAGLLVMLGVLMTSPREGTRYIGIAVLGVVVALSHWQLRTSPQRAVMVVAVGVWFMTSVTIFLFAGVHSVSVFIYPFTVAMAGWILGRRWLVGMSLATILFVTTLGIAEYAGFFQPTARVSPLNATMQIVAVLMVIAFLAHSASQNLVRSRDRAIALAAQVQTLNTELEARVAKRTAELARAMEHLQESREELVRSQAKATLSALVASVTHELSTPIGNSILIASSLADHSRDLARQIETSQLKKSTLTSLNSALDDGSQMLMRNLARADNLLKNFKQVSADQASEQRRRFDLREVVAEVVASLNPSLKNQPHRIVQDIAPGIVMDSLPGPLGQVVINVINNAYLHAFEGRKDGVLTIRASDSADTVQLRFEDNGVGMSQEVLLHLFEPFYSTKIGQGGSGLGMSIVESIVRKTLGGSLHVQSAPGSGTTIEVQLPKSAPEYTI